MTAEVPALTAEQVAAATLVVPIDSVRPHPKNANKGNVAAVRESIRANGLFRSIVVQKSTGFILAGNTTWQSCKEENLREIAIIELDVTDQQAVKILLADNKMAQLGDGYDDRLLAELLGEVQASEDWSGTGWAQDDLFALLEEMGDRLDPVGLTPEATSPAASSAGGGLDDGMGSGGGEPERGFQVTVRFVGEEDAVAFFALLGVERTGFLWWPPTVAGDGDGGDDGDGVGVGG